MKNLRRWETTIPLKEERVGSRLTRGKSMDPRNIQYFEQEAFSFIAQKSNSEESSTTQSGQEDDVGVFSMEKYESEKDKQEEKAKSSGCCCSAAPVVPRTVKATSKYSIENNTSLLLPPSNEPDKITIVLDLDETLVHSSFVSIPNPDFTFMLASVPNPIKVFVLIRPNASDFIDVLGDKFELIIFTAANKPYADYVIDQIDKGKNIKHRLYKESCSDLNGATVKDLSLLNRDLKRVIIIDNSKIASLLQPYNAVPVNTWTDDKSDTELLQIASELLPHANDENVYDFLIPNENNENEKKKERMKMRRQKSMIKANQESDDESDNEQDNPIPE